ncbi:MAG: hypothetical protein A4E63_02287 [Syntrophorhabdus sp. PtaU1.Bin050]|jgi:hypothetical protein|nr:MAG: hypothetical protein A4E63_02287 [Syntrophorhabdus sp. PtaU1.Bin050]
MNQARAYITGFIIFILSLSLAHEVMGAAERKTTDPFDAQKAKELLVGQTVKVFAKGYIAVTDIDKVKQTNIAKLQKMDDHEFKRKYAAIYRDMNGLSPETKTVYGINDKMDRSAAITKIRSATKDDLYTIIDSIPDAFITKHFGAYVAEKGLDLRQSLSTKEIKRFWKNIKRKIEAE